MKRVEERRPQTSAIVYKALVVIAAALALILIAGTIYGFAKRRNPAAGITPSQPPQSSGEESVFSGIGTMRIPTSGSEPETLVIKIAFPYDKNDRPFSEELASRVSWFKNTTIDYLGALSPEELAALDTNAVNAELLKRYNSELRLGQIRELYLLEYMRL